MTAPFDFVGDGEVGVVCVHGFTSTPYEVHYLGERLARAGFHVHGPMLPGHGTSLDDLDATRWEDWVGAVEQAFDTMQARCRRVALVGQSLGGLLSLHLAARRPEVACVASLAAPLWLDGLGRRVGALAQRGLFDRLGLRIPKFSGSDVLDPKVRAENPSYDAIPLKALGQLVRFMPVVDEVLPQISQPVLVMHAIHDHTAPVACAYRIAHRARAERLHILPRSYHLIAVDVERDIVAEDVIDFVGDHACAT